MYVVLITFESVEHVEDKRRGDEAAGGMWHRCHDWRFTCVSDDKLTVVHVHRTCGLRQSAFGISVRLTEFRDYHPELSHGWLREACLTRALTTH